MADVDEIVEHIPEVRFATILQRRRIASDLIAQHAVDVFDADALTAISDELGTCRGFALDDDAYEPLGFLLSSFAGRKVTLSSTDDLAWRLAAGYDELIEGKKLFNSFVKCRMPWTPMQIMSSVFLRTSRQQRPILEMRFRLLGGLFGGLTFIQIIPYWWVVGKLGADLGVRGRDRRHRPDHRELGGFLLQGKLDLADPEKPRLDQYRAPSGALTYNRALRLAREKPCPLGFTHTCYECQMGWLEPIPDEYKRRFCTTHDEGKSFKLIQRPVHPEHHILKRCVYCQADQAYFDAVHTSRYCIQCQQKQIRLYGGR